MNLREQLTSVQTQMAEEKGKTVDKNQELISQLESKEAELLQAIMVEDQQQASQLRIQDATEQAAYFLDNLVIEGLTMRELCVDEPQYQMLRIAVQNKIINLAEENSKQIAELQSEENKQQLTLKSQITELQGIIENGKTANATLTRENGDLHSLIAQVNLDKADAEAKRDAAVRELETANIENTRLNGHIDDLRKEIAVGARNAYKVIDSEEQSKQMKELADKIKASRIYVYDVVPDDVINPRSYTAKRADDGTNVKYNWTQAKNYVELKDPNEVQQFRDQHASHQEAVSNPPLVQPVQDSITPPTAPEATFPELPRAEAPKADIPAEVQLAIPTPSDSRESGVTKAELESRLAQFAQEHGLVKQAVA